MKLDKKCFCGIIIAAVSILQFLAGPLQAAPTNGDFSSSDLTVWNPHGNVTYNGGEQNVILDEYNSGGDNTSSLWQNFSIGDQDRYLYFDIAFNSEVEPGCDHFYAMLDGIIFYHLNNTGAPADYTDKVTVQGPDNWNQRVILDVELFADPDATLSLVLLSDIDGILTRVKLDNIGVSDTFPTIMTVPVPGAMLLAAIGAGLAGWLRRSGKLR